MPVRIGAVTYLNARPLVRGLEQSPGRFEVRYDLPSRCASLLHAGDIDLGLIPSIEYLGGDYRVVPGVGVVSDGAVASVAIFTRVPVADIRSLALDTSSRTSVALVKVLCARHFGITPVYVSAGPDLAAMLDVADAALLIGEPALLADYERRHLQKIDLGAAWKAMTGLPFVYAFWAGAPDVLTSDDVRRLQQARDDGRRDSDEVAAQYLPQRPRSAGARGRLPAPVHPLRHRRARTGRARALLYPRGRDRSSARGTAAPVLRRAGGWLARQCA